MRRIFILMSVIFKHLLCAFEHVSQITIPFWAVYIEHVQQFLHDWIAHNSFPIRAFRARKIVFPNGVSV